MLEPRTTALDPTAAGWHSVADLVLLDDQPTVMALYREETSPDPAECVVAWVIALPDGNAVILPALPEAGAPILTTLVSVRRRWARQMQAELVLVANRDALRLAA